jgi:hypothetical protein
MLDPDPLPRGKLRTRQNDPGPNGAEPATLPRVLTEEGDMGKWWLKMKKGRERTQRSEDETAVILWSPWYSS